MGAQRWSIWRRLSVAGVAVAVALATVAPAAAEPEPTQPSTVGAGEVPIVIGSPQQDRAMNAIIDLAQAELGDAYGGVVWDDAKGTMTVRHRGAVASRQLASRWEAVVRAEMDINIEFEPVEQTDGELELLAAALIDSPATVLQGVQGRAGGGYFPEERKIVLLVMQEDDPEAWRRAVAEKGLSDVVQVHNASQPADGQTAEESRRRDYAPFTGGSNN